jgi:hypothetical protein
VDASSGRGLLPWSWGIDRLSKAKNYYVSTTTADGLPHCMPVWGVWLDDAFYFSSGRRSRKARNLEKNPRCVVCPEGADQAVVMEGIVERIEEGPIFRSFVEAYKGKYNFDMDTMDMTETRFSRFVLWLLLGSPKIWQQSALAGPSTHSRGLSAIGGALSLRPTGLEGRRAARWTNGSCRASG